LLAQLGDDIRDFITVFDSWELFQEIKTFLEDELNTDVFKEITKKKPYDFAKDEAAMTFK